jgi:hypothetical protein
MSLISRWLLCKELIKRFIHKIGIAIKLFQPSENNQTIARVIPATGIEILFALALLVSPSNRMLPVQRISQFTFFH